VDWNYAAPAEVPVTTSVGSVDRYSNGWTGLVFSISRVYLHGTSLNLSKDHYRHDISDFQCGMRFVGLLDDQFEYLGRPRSRTSAGQGRP
jgi:hypothetical protein